MVIHTICQEYIGKKIENKFFITLKYKIFRNGNYVFLDVDIKKILLIKISSNLLIVY
jgi:hypothetical protein